MSLSSRALRLTLCLAAALALAGCGKKDSGTGNAVAMKDLEVVDGTATDAMTDLDGVRAQGTASVPTEAANAGAASSSSNTTAASGNASAANEPDAEAVPEQ